MKRLLTSCFGLGFLPIAPGTWGSLPVAVIFALLCYFCVPAFVVPIVLFFIMAAASAICVLMAPAVIESTGNKDPGQIVVDEVAGQAITFIGAFAVGTSEILAVTTAGFLLFRLFDIVKPWPCRKLELLPMGWGVLCDDLMAGIYAAIVLQICVRLWFGG